MPSCAATVLLRSSHSNLSKAVRFHECGTLRYAQVPSETLCFNIGPTVHKRLKRHNSRNRHNRLKSHGHPPLLQRSSTVFNSPNGPVGPKRPKSPNGPKDGCPPSISVSQSPNFPRRTQKKLRKNFANRNYCVSLELGRVVRERP